MSIVATLGALIGVAIVVMAGIGLLRFRTPYARIHAAGKASPVAFVVVAVGVGLELGGAGAARLVLASVALVITLPVAVHLLFRAVHTATPRYDPPTDELSR
jgi:multicomponent Na+:H+ antiporter subunit G